MSAYYPYHEHRDHSRWETFAIRGTMCRRLTCDQIAVGLFHDEPLCSEHLGESFASWVEVHEEMRKDGKPVDGHGDRRFLIQRSVPPPWVSPFRPDVEGVPA